MEVDPVKVHIASTDVPIGTPAASRRRSRRTVFQTVTLTADDPAQQLLPASGNRAIAMLQALDADVTVSGNLSDAAAGSGTVMPAASTAPWPVEHDAAVYAGATLTGTNTARISVTAVYED